MNNFWENILRYPRFFISSLAGLILVLLSPLKNFLRTTKSRIVLGLFVIGFFSAIFIVVKTMVGL